MWLKLLIDMSYVDGLMILSLTAMASAPHNSKHEYAPLALLEFDGFIWVHKNDLRKTFWTSTEMNVEKVSRAGDTMYGPLTIQNTLDINETLTTHKDLIVNGDVGIGTTSPSTKLTISGTGTVIALTDPNNVNRESEHSITFGRSKIEASNFNSHGYDYESGFKFHTYYYNRTEKEHKQITPLVIQANGYIGIGTTSPGGMLHIKQSEFKLDLSRISV